MRSWTSQAAARPLSFTRQESRARRRLENVLRYVLFANISALPHEAGLLAPRTYVREAMNIGSLTKLRNVTDSNLKQ